MSLREHCVHAIQGMLSGVSDQMDEAENFFHHSSANVDALMISLIEIAQGHENVHIRQGAAVVFRRQIARSDSQVWDTLHPDAQTNIKHLLISSVMNESTGIVCRALGDCISAVLAACVAEGWDDLLPFLFQCTQEENELLREVSLSIFEEIIPYLVENGFEQSIPALASVIQDLLLGNSLKVRKGALRVCTTLVTTLDKNSDRKKLRPLQDSILTSLSSTLEQGDCETTEEMLQYLMEVAEHRPTWYSSSLSSFAAAGFEIANSDGLSKGVRFAAIEFLMTLTEALPSSIAKIHDFIPSVLHMLITWLFTYEAESNWEDSVISDETEDDCYDIGLESLDRFAAAIGGELIFPVIQAQLSELIQSEHWLFRFAACQTLTQVAEGCSDQLMDSLENVVSVVQALANDGNQLVRWAAIGVFGQFSIDAAPSFQYDHYAVVLEVVSQALSDESARVQAQASNVIQNFFDISDADFTQTTLSDYFDHLLEKLVGLMGSSHMYVVENALGAISSIAEGAESLFTKYYRTIMDSLKHILSVLKPDEHRVLRGRAVECISLVAKSVDRSLCVQDIKEVLDFLVQSGISLDPNDPQTDFIQNSLVRICHVLLEDFVPYLGYVVPPMIDALEREVEFVVTEMFEEAPSEEDGWDSMIFDLKGVGSKRVSLKTSELQEKNGALERLIDYVSHLKGLFSEYLAPLIHAVIPLIRFKYLPEIRKSAASIMHDIFISLHEANASQEVISDVWNLAYPELLEEVQNERELDALCVAVDAFGCAIESAGRNSLTQERLMEVVGWMKSFFQNAMSRRDRIHTIKQDDEYEEGDDGAFVTHLQIEDMMLTQWGEMFGYLFKSQDGFPPLFESEFWPIVGEMLNLDKPDTYHQVAIAVIDDYMDYSCGLQSGLVNDFVNALGMHCMSNFPAVRQSALYGVGIAGVRSAEILTRFNSEIHTVLKSQMQRENSKSGSMFEGARCNAVSSYLKIFLTHGPFGGSSEDQILQSVFDALPVEADKNESRIIYKNLLEFIQKNHPIFTSPESIPHLIEIFGAVWGTHFTDDDIRSGMAQVFSQLRQGFGDEYVFEIVSNLDETKQRRIAKMIEASA